MANKYGFADGKRPVVELTRVQAVKDGHHFTQYGMATGTEELENGMLVAVDHIKGEVGKVKAITEKVYLHASVEHMYKETAGRDEFVVKETDDFLPRVYDLRTGDTFETNALIWSDTDFADYAAIKAAVAAGVFAYADTSGYIKLAKTAGTGVVTDLRVKAVVTLPNGQTGVKLVVM
ncbi:MAG TPA: hypothetical protein GX707_12775 [Epulopiscium sp.]|nr:hypothetical protein [Candidatus Epulonipiscium sp.]